MLSGMTTDMSEKVRENKLRWRADRRGYWVLKPRRYDELALDYKRYALIRQIWDNPAAARRNKQLALTALKRGHGLTMDELEAALRLPPEELALLPAVIESQTDAGKG